MVRNPRVLVRRVLAAVRYGETVPAAYLDLVDDLAEGAAEVADALTARIETSEVRPALEAVARASSTARHSAVRSAVVVPARVRSMVVDLLELTGLDEDQALARMPRPAPATGPLGTLGRRQAAASARTARTTATRRAQRSGIVAQ